MKLKDYYCLVKFTRRTGVIRHMVTGGLPAAMEMYCLNGNITPAQDAMIFNLESGDIYKYFEGTKEGWPKITEPAKLKWKNVEQYCPGLLEAARAEEDRAE